MDKKDLDYAKKNKKTILKFHCPICLQSGNSQVPSKLEAEVKDLKDIVNMLVATNSDIVAQNKEILEKLNAKNKDDIRTPAWPKVEKNIQHSVEEVLCNQAEKEEKKCNLILFGVTESAQTTEGKDNTREDHNKAVDIVCHLDDLIDSDDLRPTFCKVSRLGRKKPGQDEKPRPIKVELPDIDIKNRALKNARLLKDYKMKKIGVSHDKTKKELDADRVLRADLRKKREENTGVEFIIYDKKVMKKEEADKLREHKEKLYKERQNKLTERGDPVGEKGPVQA